MRRNRAANLQSAPDRSFIIDLEENHISLLQRMRRRGMTFSGRESDEERLNLLQLYVAGLVTQKTDRHQSICIHWGITVRGRAAVRAAELRLNW